MIRSILEYLAPVYLAALAGLLTESAGLLNIALEGSIIAGAFLTLFITHVTGSPIIGISGALLGTGVLSWLYGYATMRGKGNIFITGLAFNLLIPGTAALLATQVFGTRGVIRMPLFPEIPHLGVISIPSLLILCLYPVFRFILYRTQAGLRLRACGMDTRSYEIRGFSPITTRSTAFFFSGVLTGGAGVYLTLSLGAYIPYVSSGKGWIALAAVYLGKKRPGGILLACLFFAGAEWLANRAQGLFDLPASLFLGFPYFLTFLALIVEAGGLERLHKRT